MALGTYTKEIYPKNFEEVLDIGEWKMLVNNFRLKVSVERAGDYGSNPEEHKISLYRKARYYKVKSYLKHENFRNGDLTEVSINNENYVKIGEMASGQVASGMFYSSQNLNEEILIQTTGPSPYKTVNTIYLPENHNGLVQYNLKINQGVDQPYFWYYIIPEWGNIKFYRF